MVIELMCHLSVFYHDGDIEALFIKNLQLIYKTTCVSIFFVYSDKTLTDDYNKVLRKAQNNNLYSVKNNKKKSLR